MDTLKQDELIYPWNTQDYTGRDTRKPFYRAPKHIELFDETLRDGLQSPSVTVPSTEEKLKLIHYMDSLGIDYVNAGLPAAGKAFLDDIVRIVKEVSSNKMKIKVASGGRTVMSDLIPIVELSQKTGYPIEADIYLCSSMIRRYVEDWNFEKMLKSVEECVGFCTKNGLEVMFITEDTTRSDPRVLQKMYTTAIESGARRLCLCDTVGAATPDGVINLVEFVRKIIWDSGEEIKLDWHGHNDRGCALHNAVSAAIDAGVDRIEATCLGIGERAGNTAIDQVLINLFLSGVYEGDISQLGDYCLYVSKVCGVPIPKNYPAIGEDAFRTATGVHAAAIIKAMKRKQSQWLADYVYSSVPAHSLGLKQKIEVGPVSGKCNVTHWLESKGLEITTERVEKILSHAKQLNRILKDDEIQQVLEKA